MPLVLRRVSWLSVLALGCTVGLLMAATAIADRVLRGPFTAPSAQRLVAVFAHHVATGRERQLTSFAIFQDWKARATTFERLSGYTLSTVNLLGEPTPQTTRAAQVTADFFDTFDTPPAVGRGFAAFDPQAVCVISDWLWRSRFGASPSAIGSVMHLETVNGNGPASALTIVGVAPRLFRFPERVDIWTPLSLPEALQTNRSGQWFGVVGRLRPAVSLEAATAEMRVVVSAVQAEQPGQQPPHDAQLVPVKEVLTARYRALVLGLVAAAGVLLLVVIASVGGVLVAAALREQPNDRIRLSLGSGHGRLIAHAGRAGAAAGLIAFAIALPVAFGCVSALGTVTAELFDTVLAADVSWLSALIGLACATLLPGGLAMVVKKQSLAQAQKGGPWPNRPSVGPTRATTSWRSGLIIAEIALSVLLLAAAGDLLTRVEALRAIDLGFETDGLLTTRLSLPSSRYSGERAPMFYEALVDRLRGVPSVADVAVSSDDPLFGVSANPEFTLQFENRVLAPDERVPILVNGVTDSYFDVLGLRLLEGIAPARRIAASGTLQAAINETLAARLFPHERPIGRRFRFGGRNPPWWTIVGVVADARNDGPLAPPKPTAYLSYPAFGKTDMTLLVKTKREAGNVVDLGAVIAQLDPNLPIPRMVSATDLVEARFAGLHIGALVVTVLAAAALMLSGLGLYAVLSAVSTETRPEIGLRIALGARPRDLIRLVFGRAVTLVAVGLILGALCATAAGLTFSRFVNVDVPATPHVLALFASVAAMGLIAAAAPAWQATRVSPVETLRAE